MGQPAYLKKMTSVWGRGHSLWQNKAYKAFTGLSSYRSDNKDHKDPLRPNKSLARPFEALNLPFNTLVDVARYTKKNLEQIIQMVLQAWLSKDAARNKAFKARSPDVYCDRFYIEYYKFC